MVKINNKKIISILSVLTFVFGLFLSTSMAQASVTSFMDSGSVYINPSYSTQYNGRGQYNQNNQSYNQNYNQNSVQGCEGRTTGYSQINGQPCGNTQNQNSYNRTTTVKNYDKNNTTVVRNVDTSNSTSDINSNYGNKSYGYNSNYNNNVSDINENYGSLTANALIGSQNSFMPTGLLQWILMAILIVAIIFLWRYIHRSEEVYMAEPMKHA